MTNATHINVVGLVEASQRKLIIFRHNLLQFKRRNFLQNLAPKALLFSVFCGIILVLGL